MLSGDVTFARVISLFHLHHHDSQTIAELAEATGLSHAAASRMVDGLYREGVVPRPPPDDHITIHEAAGTSRFKAFRIGALPLPSSVRASHRVSRTLLRPKFRYTISTEIAVRSLQSF